MGNSLGMKPSSVKIMKINGETFRLKAPVRAGSVMETHPGHVLLESESVKHYGAQAKPLEPQMELKPKRLYFLVQLPESRKVPAPARRVSSGIQMSAKDRLESLMLARRSASDLTFVNTGSSSSSSGADGGGREAVRVRLRLPKAEVEKLMAESKDGAEMTAKIVDFYRSGGGSATAEESFLHRNGDDGSIKHGGLKLREKRVSFLPVNEEGIHLAVPT